MPRACCSRKDDVVVPSSRPRAKTVVNRGRTGGGGGGGGDSQEASIEWSALEKLKYFNASKRVLRYAYHGDFASMTNGKGDHNKRCANKWAVVSQKTVVTTVIDGVETSNVAEPGDFVMCGPLGEKYVVRFEKMPQLYERAPDDPSTMVVRPGEPRRVALYDGENGSFVPSWGGSMMLNRGDYVVREAKNKYYRIEKGVFKDTYTEPDR